MSNSVVPPPIEKSTGKWIVDAFRVGWYVAVIVGLTWYFFSWDRRMRDLEVSVEGIKGEALVTQQQHQRLVRQINTQFKRVWIVLHRQDLDEEVEGD